jgi:hypothetical protein
MQFYELSSRMLFQGHPHSRCCLTLSLSSHAKVSQSDGFRLLSNPEVG